MLEIKNLSLRLGHRQVLDDVSFPLRPHRLTVLVGRNGSGKSTLLNCVNQQLPYTGTITEGEKNLALIPARERAKSIAILPQSLPSPHITGRELVSLGRNPWLDFTGRLTDTDKQAVEAALRDADAAELAGRYVDTLSGGEKQRVLLAMILAQNTPIALLDEPTAALDLVCKEHIASYLNTYKASGGILLLTTHDVLELNLCDAWFILKDGVLEPFTFTGDVAELVERL